MVGFQETKNASEARNIYTVTAKYSFQLAQRKLHQISDRHRVDYSIHRGIPLREKGTLSSSKSSAVSILPPKAS
jgi:hypothetical protein